MIRAPRGPPVKTSEQKRALPTKKQLWKVNDEKAQKYGMCKSVYWVKQRQETRIRGPASKSKWVTGNVYRGQWKQNRKDGYGTQIWANGNKYEGDWVDGKQHGHGVLWVKSKKKKLRKVYAGRWEQGLNAGLGVYYYKNKDRYEGNWANGMRQGQGTHFHSNGDVYVGEWNQDKQSGFGTLTRANGDVYEGEWLGGKREGAGIYYYKLKEKIYDGEWVNDIPKCGVYCASSEFFATEEGDELFTGRDRLKKRQRPIPRLRLLDANTILAERITLIQKERQAVRNMPFIQLEKLFSEEGLDDLRGIFARYDPDMTGSIAATDFAACLGDLKFDLEPVEIAQLLLDLDKANVPAEKLSFSEFVKGAHLVDSMKAKVALPGIHSVLEHSASDNSEASSFMLQHSGN